MTEWFWIGAFYLLGSIPTGYLIGRAHGMDIRQHGSGNIGATNVGRVLGRTWGLFAFAIDFLKGFLALNLMRIFWFPGQVGWETAVFLVLCGLAAILGHNYTPWLGFKGGKGIATSGGVLCALVPWTFFLAFTVWLLAVAVTRTISIASLLACVTLPIATFLIYPGEWVYFGLSLAAGLLGIVRHTSNIGRLLAGTEPKLGQKKP